MIKIKICGQNVNLRFTTDPVLVNNQTAYGYADFLSNEILICLMKEADVWNTLFHEYTHWFNRFMMTDPTKDTKFNEEDRCSYVGNIVSCLIRENGIGILAKIDAEYKKCMKGVI